MDIEIKEIVLSDGSISEQVFIETEVGTTIMFKDAYDRMIAEGNNE